MTANKTAITVSCALMALLSAILGVYVLFGFFAGLALIVLIFGEE